MTKKGQVFAVSGLLATVRVDFPVLMYEAVFLGASRIRGEVVRIGDKEVEIQIYGSAAGLMAGEDAVFLGELLGAEAGLSSGAWNFSALKDIRIPRTCEGRFLSSCLFASGLRVLDTLFPMRLGGSALLAGASGTGKTMLLRTMAKSCAADVVIFVFCGARGSDVSEFLESLSPAQAERTVVFAHTASEVPAAAEIAVLNAMAAAEHCRSNGSGVLLLVDGLSYCGISAERTNRIVRSLFACAGCVNVKTKSAPKKQGAITLVASSLTQEPVCRLADTLWVLDKDTAVSHIFPAVDCSVSHSRYREELSGDASAQEFRELRKYLTEVKEGTGYVLFSEEEKTWLSFLAAPVDLVFARQDLCGSDVFYSIRRSTELLRVLKELDGKARAALTAGISSEEITAIPLRMELLALRDIAEKEFPAKGKEWLSSFAEKLALKSAVLRESKEAYGEAV